MGKWLCLWLGISAGVVAWSQEPDLVFHHLTQADGLSYNIVNCFLKDSRGLLWVGTYNGLNRYDGAHFKVFRKEQQPNSIIDNTVHDLVEDDLGNIWGATEAGVFRYNPYTAQFKNYLTLPQKETQVVFNILKDSSGTIWASNAFNIVKYEAAVDSFINMPLAPSSQNVFDRIFTKKNGFAASPDGKGLWFVTGEGLVYYDINTRELYAAKKNGADALFGTSRASALCVTPFGYYWYCDNERKMLIAFNPVSRRVMNTIYFPANTNVGAMATVFEDHNHTLWLSTWNYEIYNWNYRHENRLRTVRHNEAIPTSVAGDFFWDAKHESDGSLWLGTVGGISRINTQKAFYKIHYFTDSLLMHHNASIDFIAEDPRDKTWWLGTTAHRLLHYNPFTTKTITYDMRRFPKNRTALTPFAINDMVFLHDKVYLFSDAGAWVSNGSIAFKPLLIKGIADTVTMNSGKLLNDSLIYMTGNQMLWRWNRYTGKTDGYAYNTQSTIDNKKPVTAFLVISASGEPWVLAGDDYFARVVGRQLELIQAVSAIPQASVGYYTSMTADRQNNFWITKKGDGLYVYNTNSGAYHLYKQHNGLVMDHVMAAAVDNTGRVWSASYNQFSILNPSTSSFVNYTLPVNENWFDYENYATAIRNGNLLFTLGNKVVEFYTDRVKPLAIPSAPVISAVLVAGKEKVSVSESSLYLAANENDIQFHFGLLADNTDAPYDIEYMLDGAEKLWNTASASFDATYNKLPPGNYVFRVRGVARNKEWQTPETALRVHVASPFYRTIWFMALVFVVAVSALYAFYRYRLRQHRQVMQLENKAQQLEKEKTAVMYENLKQQLNPHFLFNSIGSLSGLIETDQQMAGKFLKQMSGIYRYILQNSDNERVSLKEEIAFAQLYIQLQKTRFGEGLQVDFDINEEFLHLKIAPVTLQNLFENAIKHNVLSKDMPLIIQVFVEENYLVVQNNLQRKKIVETSNKKGLEQLISMYHFMSASRVIIEEKNHHFSVKVPLL